VSRPHGPRRRSRTTLPCVALCAEFTVRRPVALAVCLQGGEAHTLLEPVLGVRSFGVPPGIAPGLPLRRHRILRAGLAYALNRLARYPHMARSDRREKQRPLFTQLALPSMWFSGILIWPSGRT
jgi:hypothetical protein